MKQFLILLVLCAAALGVTEHSRLPYELFERHGAVMLLIEPVSGRIVDANQAAAVFYGHNRQQLRTMKISEINILNPDEVAKERNRALQERRNYFIFPHQLANGAIKTVEVYSWPIMMGEEVLLFSIIHDISSRKIAEEELHRYKDQLEKLVGERTVDLKNRTAFFIAALTMGLLLQAIVIAVLVRAMQARRASEKRLAESEARFRRLAENAQDLIFRYELQPDRRFSYVSPAATAMTGFTPEEHYADPDLGFKLIHPADRPLLAELSEGKLTPHTPLTMRWIRKDGRIIWTEQRNTLIFDEENNPVAVEGIARDITELKTAQDRAILYEQGRKQALTNLLINLAHQWRQPLNVIGLIAQRIEEELGLEGEKGRRLQNWVKAIMGEIRALSVTISRFTDLYQSREKPRPIEMAALCEEAILLLKGRLDTLHLQIETQIDSKIRLLAARTDWVEIFIKLIENVMAITHERRLTGAKIRIAAETKEECVEITVEDNAGGIDAAIMPDLFEPYSTTAFKSREKGLGLYLIRRILEDRYRGSIRAENGDQGARFILNACHFTER